MRIGKTILLSFTLVMVFALPLQADMVVIVNPSNRISRLSAEDIQDIYLFKKIIWKHGTRITPVDLPIKDPARQRFSERLLRRNLEEMENHYLMRALAGQGQPPITAGSPDEVKKLIKTMEGAIGYIDEKDVDASVKVIKIIGRRSIR